ncbi:hypothetical protein ACFL5K_02260, partial [Gemmatimonadota bacterium]
YCSDDGNLSMQAEKDESFRSESKKKAIFSCFNFDMGNIGLFSRPIYQIPVTKVFLSVTCRRR